MRIPTLAMLLGALALITGCGRESSQDTRVDSRLLDSHAGSPIKTVLLETLAGYQSKSEGLYAVSNGIFRVGAHSVELLPVVESEHTMEGKYVLATRIEVKVDGVERPEAAFGAIGIAGTREKAIPVSLGEWYLGFALPFFRALGEKESSFATGGYNAFAGTLGLRGGEALGWVDGSDAMERKILDAALPAVSPTPDFVVLDLKVMVPPEGKPGSECRINTQVSADLAARLLALDWPRSTNSYMFKQAFVLKKKKP